VGCGTGICARLLARAGAEVIGIEPNDGMLAEARRIDAETSSPHPAGRVEYRHGSGERTGLEDDSVDLVVCAQAFHWFDATAALSEFHRILRPGGRLVLMWNVRDDADPFTAAYGEIARRAQHDATQRGRFVRRNRGHSLRDHPLFTNARRIDFDNPHRLDWPALLGRARSASYFPTDDPLRSELEADLRSAFDRYADDGVVILVQRTELTLADARA
jgi:SAM-dependent methyltransferase